MSSSGTIQGPNGKLTIDGKDYNVYLTPVAVVQPPPPVPPVEVGPSIPNNAKNTLVTHPQLLSKWMFEHDPATPGTISNASITNIYSTTYNRFVFTGTDGAGFRAHCRFIENDFVSNKFCYSVKVAAGNWENIQNLELDINHTDKNGLTYFNCLQLSNYSKTVEYTAEQDSISSVKYKKGWNPSNIKIDTKSWEPGSEHIIKLFSNHSAAPASGLVTYIGAEIDGVYQSFKDSNGMNPIVVPSAIDFYPKRWTPGNILINYQIEAAAPAGATSLVDTNAEITIYNWS